MEYNQKIMNKNVKYKPVYSAKEIPRRSWSSKADKYIVALIILSISFVTTADADSNITVHVTYMSYVDPDLGFYKVLDVTTHNPSPYIDHILTINQGDTIIWKNDADKPTTMTIVSEDHLFPDAILKSSTDVFPYLFNQPGGKYVFHLAEHGTATQTVMVRAIFTPTVAPTAINTPIPTINTPIPTINTPIPTINMPTPTPVSTDNPVSTVNPVSTDILISKAPAHAPVNRPISPIAIMSIIVAILSIYIIYKTGKDRR